MYTVRIIDRAGAPTDAEYATVTEAFAAVYGEPSPLSEESVPIVTDPFAIFNEEGVCFHVIGGSLEQLGTVL